MNLKKLTPPLLLGIAICFVIVLMIKINHKRSEASEYGKELFDGQIPNSYLRTLTQFGTRSTSIKLTVLVLFDPECEACYSQIQNILRNRERLNNSHLVLASSIPQDQILEYAQKFNFTDFNMVSICALNSKAILNRVLSYPTIIIYNSSGKYLKGFRGSAKFESISDFQ